MAMILTYWLASCPHMRVASKLASQFIEEDQDDEPAGHGQAPDRDRHGAVRPVPGARERGPDAGRGDAGGPALAAARAARDGEVRARAGADRADRRGPLLGDPAEQVHRPQADVRPGRRDRKSTRLNSSHPSISYAVFCLKKKKKIKFTIKHKKKKKKNINKK